MNFIERCRKDANWPELFREVPQFGRGSGVKKTWSISQDELAKFIGAVRSRADDLQAELVSAKERVSKLADEKAALATENAQLRSQIVVSDLGGKVRRACEATGIESGVALKISEHVEDAAA